MEPTPSASVLCLRNQADEQEVLMLRRTEQRHSAAGKWAYPGGLVEPGDGPDSAEPFGDARKIAAQRELAEETSLVIATEALRPLSRWVTPPQFKTRYDTTFYCVEDNTLVDIVIDQHEVDAFRWFNIHEIRNDPSMLDLLPPTYWNLWLIDTEEPVECFPQWPTGADYVELFSPLLEG